MRLNKILSLGCLALLFLPASAQNGNGNASPASFCNIPTPNAGELMRFGNVPVNHHLGTADISIPLYRYSCGGVDLDVRLQYDSSGLPMNRLPGWTGHGWTLMAGGSITRQKIGHPDDMELDGAAGSGYTAYENYFKRPSIGNSATSDISPDVFHFNFLGKSGRFLMGSDGQWKVISDDIIDVQTDVSDDGNYLFPFIRQTSTGTDVISHPKTIKGFTLVDENGTKYIFGGSTDAIEYSTQFVQNYSQPFSPDYFWAADTWMLKKVVDHLGNCLYNFLYERGRFITQVSTSWHLPSNVHEGYGKLLDGSYVSIINAPVYLTGISINNLESSLSFGRVNAFPAGPASRSLYPSFYNNGAPVWGDSWSGEHRFHYAESSGNEITPYQASYANVDKHRDPLSSMELDLLKGIASSDGVSYIFNYDYSGRIHLDELSVRKSYSSILDLLKDSLAAGEGKYKFVYNDYAGVPSDYLTDNVDYWGYCNAAPSGTPRKAPAQPDPEEPLNPGPSPEGDPHNPQDGEQEYERRKPNFTCAMKGMLTGITYPTGGSTHFEYEQNTCSSYMMQHQGVEYVRAGEDFEVPGLRIKSISDYDGNVLLGKKEFDYTSNGRSSGDLYHVPARLKYNPNLAENKLFPNDTILETVPTGLSMVEYDHGAAWGGGICSLTPLWDSRAPQMGYRVVTETHQYGKTTYRYQGCTKPLFISAMAGADMFLDRQYYKGILLSESHYDSSGKAVRTVDYQYGVGKILHQQGAYLPGFCMGELYSGTGSPGQLTLYTMLFPKIYLSKMTLKEWFGNQYVTTTRAFECESVDVTVGKPYEHLSHILMLNSETTGRLDDTLTLRYSYLNCSSEGGVAHHAPRKAHEQVPGEGDITAVQHECQSPSFFFPRTSASTLFNGQLVKESRTLYDDQFQGFDGYLPVCELECGAGSLSPDTILLYKEYESTPPGFRLKRYVDRDGVETLLLRNRHGWLSGIVRNSHGNVQYLDPVNPNGSRGVTSSIPDEVFGTMPTFVTECVYDSNGRIEKITGGNNRTSFYRYDLLGRLKNVQDGKQKTLRTFLYNHRNK